MQSRRSAQVYSSLDYVHKFAQLAVRCFTAFVCSVVVVVVSVFSYALSSCCFCNCHAKVERMFLSSAPD